MFQLIDAVRAHFGGANGGAQIAFSQTGLMVYVEGGQRSDAKTMPTWHYFDGRIAPALTAPDLLDGVSLSPDGTRLTMTARFRPKGLGGLLYWYSVAPFHNIVFGGMLRGIRRRAHRAYRNRHRE